MTPEFYSLQAAPAKLAADNDNTFSRFSVFSLTRSLLQQTLRNANAGKLDLLQIEFAQLVFYLLHNVLSEKFNRRTAMSFLFLSFQFWRSESLKMFYKS